MERVAWTEPSGAFGLLVVKRGAGQVEYLLVRMGEVPYDIYFRTFSADPPPVAALEFHPAPNELVPFLGFVLDAADAKPAGRQSLHYLIPWIRNTRT